MRAVHVVLAIAVLLMCQCLASAATVDYPIRVVNVGQVAGMNTNFMRQVVEVNYADQWVSLTGFLSTVVPTALQAGALPPVGTSGTAMLNVPIYAGKAYVPKGPKPVWLRVTANAAAGITYKESAGERGKGTMANCWKWNSHFVTMFTGWATVDKFVRRTPIRIPVCEPKHYTRKSYYFVDP